MEEVFLKWFTNYADADRYSDGINYFENRDSFVKEISPNRFEVYENVNKLVII